MPMDWSEMPPIPPEFADQQLLGRMGIEVVSTSLDAVVGRMPVDGNRQMYGLLHGGASAVLAETLGSILATMHARPERFPLGLELACTHHRAAKDGWVTGVARPVHIGRSTSTIEIVMTDDQQRRTCTGRLTCLHRETAVGSAPP